jgi:hypothetical protein
MRFAVPTIALTGLLLFSAIAIAQSIQISSVDPLKAKVGDTVSAKGQGLGATNVDELYLTNDVEDVKVEMIEQTDKLIRFKVPSGVKPERWALMIHRKSGSGPKLLEQPVKITVE